MSFNENVTLIEYSAYDITCNKPEAIKGKGNLAAGLSLKFYGSD